MPRPSDPASTPPEASHDLIVRTSGLTRVYGRGRNETTALAGVDVAVGRGEFVGVMGPSGSGKTTLLNLVGTLDRPTSGRIFVDGVEITRLPEWSLFQIRRHRVGFIFQSFHLVPTLTAFENVLLPVLPIGATPQLRERANSLLDGFGLAGRRRNRPSELSSGEQQRVAIARALMLDPGLILADEPTGNLDSRAGIEVFRLMRQLNRDLGKTFLIVTHDPRIARRMDRIVFLADGRISATPTVDLDAEY
jgi:ABC-type lipoprotein export system ATPase subunit